MTSVELLPLIIVLAFILDALFGDPKWLPHPVIAIGKIIEAAEIRLNIETFTDAKKKLLGVSLAILLPASVFIVTTLIIAVAYSISILLGLIVSILLASTTLSTKGKSVV